MIGGLQSNKCKQLAEQIPNLWCVSSVDSEKKANELEKGRRALLEKDDAAEKLRVMVQVNTSGEEAKSGVEPADGELAPEVLVRMQADGRLALVRPDRWEWLVPRPGAFDDLRSLDGLWLEETLTHTAAEVTYQHGLDETAALVNELRHGEVSLAAETVAGAQRFSEGAGRHGSFG